MFLKEKETKMIRVLQVLPRLRRGGSQAFVMNLYRCIDRTKIQFDFIIFTKDHDDYYDEIINMGGKIYHFEKFNGLNYFSIMKKWKVFLKEHKEYKIIHFHVYSTASLYISLAKKNGLKTIVHSHSTSNGKGIKAHIKNTLQLPIRWKSDYLFACSTDAGRWLFGDKATKKKNYFIVPNGIDLQHFYFDSERRQQTRAALSLNDKFVIGHVGGFETPKNHPFIIDVFNDISKQYDSAMLLLVGDGTFLDDIKERVKQLGLNDRVVFAGLHSDVAPLLDAMDVFFFPSLWEGFPVSLVEAQASGLNCIVSDSITLDAKLTNNIFYLSLTNDSKTNWINSLFSSKNDERTRFNMDERLLRFDMKNVCKDLSTFYLKLGE